MLRYEDGELCKISDCSCLNLSAAHFQIIVFITCRRTEVMYVIIWVKKMTFINWLHKHLKELHRVSKNCAKLFLSVVKCPPILIIFLQKDDKKAKIMQGVLTYHHT